jgi:hypothetical protein
LKRHRRRKKLPTLASIATTVHQPAESRQGVGEPKAPRNPAITTWKTKNNSVRLTSRSSVQADEILAGSFGRKTDPAGREESDRIVTVLFLVGRED